MGLTSGKRPAKLVPNSQKGIFLCYVLYTTHNILWYNPDTNWVKIATYAWLDEGYNHFPTAAIPPNVVHLHHTEDGGVRHDSRPILANQDKTDIQSLHFYITPFALTLCTSP